MFFFISIFVVVKERVVYSKGIFMLFFWYLFAIFWCIYQSYFGASLSELQFL